MVVVELRAQWFDQDELMCIHLDALAKCLLTQRTNVAVSRRSLQTVFALNLLK